MAKAQSYEAKDIEVHRGLEGIRKRPSLYVSDTGSAGVVHLAKEVITNACDEAISGNADAIRITITKDGSICVSDNGRGIPVGKHPKGRDALAIVFTETHSGSKMKDEGGAYDKSAGTYGVGLAVVTALSKEVEVWSYRNKRWNYMAFTGDDISNNGVPAAKAPDFDLVVDKKKGTLVRFTPNLKLFNKGAKMDVKALVEWISDQSWFVPAAIAVVMPDGSEETFHRDGGLLGRFEEIVAGQKETPLLATEDGAIEDNVFNVSAGGVDLLIGWSSHTEPTIMSYASGHRTIHHGEHVKGVMAAMPEAFEIFMKRGDNFSKASLQSGLVVIVNCSIPNPKFNGQAKTMLTSESAGEMTAEVVRSHFIPWLKKRKALARALIDKANAITEITSAFKASKKLASQVRGPRGKSGLPYRLRVSTTKDADARELFICEGLSAEGCFATFSPILMADGTTKTFADLIRNYADGVEHLGIAWDSKSSKFVEAKLRHPRITKMVTELLEIELDDGSKVQCTPDHLWLLENGEYKRADALTEDDKIRGFQPPPDRQGKKDS